MDEDFVAIKEEVNRDRIINFYKKNKIKIYIIILALSLVGIFTYYYFEKEEEKKINFSNIFNQGIIYLNNNEKEKARQIFEKLVMENDKAYSNISLLLIVDHNLYEDEKKIETLFNNLIESSGLVDDQKNLMVFKKALFISDYVTEEELVKTLNPLINQKNVWTLNSLVFLGDYFFSKKNLLRAKEYYLQALLQDNLNTKIEKKINNKLRTIPGE